MPKLSALFQYPVKSCAGRPADELWIGERGPVSDRLLMVVDQNYHFLTQRREQGAHTRMALIRPWRIQTDGNDVLTLSAQGIEDCGDYVSGNDAVYPTWRATIFGDSCEVIDQGNKFAQWLTDFLHAPCRLVHMADSFRRRLDPTYDTTSSGYTGFADGFPILLISDASLADLNRRIVAKRREPVSRENFRATFWVEGCDPYEEDTWKRILINGMVFDVVKPCARCSITQVDWCRGVYREDKEPLVTLREYRHQTIETTGKSGVMFGQNLVHKGRGTVRVGDEIEILERK